VASPNAVDYAITNATWPVGVALPALDDIEALRVARYLLRVFVGWPRRGQPYSARISHGNRHTWIRGNVLTVNPSKGWKGSRARTLARRVAAVRTAREGAQRVPRHARTGDDRVRD
jgi:hypothetical protein